MTEQHKATWTPTIDQWHTDAVRQLRPRNAVDSMMVEVAATALYRVTQGGSDPEREDVRLLLDSLKELRRMRRRVQFRFWRRGN